MSSPIPEAKPGVADLSGSVREFRPRPWWLYLLVCLLVGGALAPVILQVKSADNQSPVVPVLAIATAIAGGGAMLTLIMTLLSINQRVVFREK